MGRPNATHDERQLLDTPELTDNSGGTAADTIAAIGATYNQAEVRNAVASLAKALNAVIKATRADIRHP